MKRPTSIERARLSSALLMSEPVRDALIEAGLGNCTGKELANALLALRKPVKRGKQRKRP